MTAAKTSLEKYNSLRLYYFAIISTIHNQELTWYRSGMQVKKEDKNFTGVVCWRSLQSPNVGHLVHVVVLQ